MPKNKVNDPITDQEIAFARLVLSGAMTDRQAAEAAGLNPHSAAYTKSKPRVRAYMLEHRAALQQQLVQQDADGQRRRTLDREQVLDRLWEIANLSPETTRGSVTGQIKALTIIVAMENFIPDRRALSAERNPAPAPTPQIYPSAWLRKQQATTLATTNDPQPTPTPDREQAQQEDSPACGKPWNSAASAPTDPAAAQSSFANSSTPSEVPELYIPPFASVPNMRMGFSLKRNPFVRPR
jgi:hypothetical protein